MAMVDLPNTAMIFPTSAALIGGLRGSVTKVGVKRILIQRSDQPACPPHQPTICLANHSGQGNGSQGHR